MVFTKVGVGSEGGAKKKSTENQEFWVPRNNPHDQETTLRLGSADEALCGKKQGQVASFPTFLIVLRANSHQEPRGKWLQVTKDLHSEGQSELLLTPGCRLWGGGWTGE